MQLRDSLHYQSFLVRCWLISPAVGEEAAVWRFAVRGVSAESSEHSFASFAEMGEFIATAIHTGSTTVDGAKSNE